jgi:hypothetical protein
MASRRVSSSAAKGGGVPVWIQIVGAIVAVIVSVYSAFIANREKNRADLLALQIANEKEVPQIVQGRFVFAGDALKSILSGKKDIAIEGLPNPEFAATDLSRQINDKMKAFTGLKQLRAVSVEFIAFTNKGPRGTDTLKVVWPGQEDIDLGSVAVNTTKLLPVFYEGGQPYDRIPNGDPVPNPTAYTYSYQLLGSRHEVRADILPRATISWIPVVGNTQGVGRALSDDDLERHLRPAAN